ncbi:hypothetical protein [Pseudomonas sp. RIT-PI-S]|uniref:hypothetical protein n=1 Tax=Pseudomonas sp. RIT-PI-S TaxID=3035295 RepID=UPI0021DAB4EF|nr:hypothetical protein [Pseudomonas sp. RIT-PI-S]
MPARPVRRTLPVRMSSLQLVLSIALGVWLGFVLMLITGWLAWRYGYSATTPLAPTPGAPVASAPAVPMPTPRNPAPAPTLPPAAVAPDADRMFDEYQYNLHMQELRQAEEAARANPSNQANPTCQFWLQQAQTAPSDHSREQVARSCN